MSDGIEKRLQDNGVTLPEAAAPVANYLAVVRDGSNLIVSGQLPMADGALLVTGKHGSAVSVEDGQRAARQCAINILAQAKAALDGDLDRIRQLVKLTIFVASEPGFTDHHKVANGASDFMAEILGPKAPHARAAVGVSALPMDAAVEIEALIAVD